MYKRPTVEQSIFVRARRRRTTVYIVRADLHNRRITTIVAKAGTAGRTTSIRFKSRDDAREFLDTILERREMLGYEQVA